MLLLAMRTMPRAASIGSTPSVLGDRAERPGNRRHVGVDLAAAEDSPG